MKWLNMSKLYLYTALYFQLRFHVPDGCQQYLLTDSMLSISDVTDAFLQGISSFCNCNTTLLSITNAVFVCFIDSPKILVYWALILDSPVITITDLLPTVDEWVNSTQVLIVQDVDITTIDATCPVLISSPDGPQCQPTNVQTQNTPFTTTIIVEIVSASVGGIVLLIITIAIIALLVKKSRRAKKVKKIHERYI